MGIDVGSDSGTGSLRDTASSLSGDHASSSDDIVVSD